MITTKGTRIWTPYGYKFVDDLYIGEKIISFNPNRGVCEYDKILSIETEYKQCMGYGINSKSMRQLLTNDHPILIWDSLNKILDRIPIQDKFLRQISDPYSVLFSAPFEPFKRSQDIEDIKWSARMAATIANHEYAIYDINHIVSDLGGYESQIWCDTFFHWNKLMTGKNYMATVRMTNKYVQDLVFNIAPRAGVGAKLYPYKHRYLMSITTNGSSYPSIKVGWFKQKIDEVVFNLTTINGSVLAKASNGTFLLACKGREGDV